MKKMIIFLVFLVLVSGCSKKINKNFNKKEALEKAWKYFRWTEYNKAVDTFQEVLDASKKGNNERLFALYGLGTVWDLRRPDRDTILACKYYSKVIELSPESEIASWASLSLARMRHVVSVGTEIDVENVCRLYSEIEKKYSGFPVAQEAFLYRQSLLISSMDGDQIKVAIKNLKSFVKANPNSKYISMAWLLMGAACDIEGDPAGCRKGKINRLKTAEVDPANPRTNNSWQYWQISTISEFEMGDFKTAREYYMKCLKEYPNDMKTHGVKLALKRMDKIEKELIKK